MSNRNFSHSVRTVFFLVLPLIGACSFAGQMAKDSVEGVTSHYSSDHFILVATIPANFGFTSKAKYSPKKGEKCEVYSPGLGGNVIRQQQKSNNTDAKNVEQTVSTDIPLKYNIADCSMELTRVSYELSASYGTGARDRDLELAGGLTVTDTRGAQDQVSANASEQRGICSWLFQISTAKAKKDNIEKILSCSAADQNWNVPDDYSKRKKPGGAVARDKLNKKIVTVVFHFSEIEEPSKDNRWIKTNLGWKPCQETAESVRCGVPPIFRSFKINGRECSIYPTCSE
ncbi:hypothetical protein JFU48_21430 [Pseudomonas sp. TH49]|uniref:hypothetical protein n=1 Tax=Pseudomonas sp. TH49 TaxID=2796413 RepID=UPI0019140BF3|nr:hypothetical protein [Pseudomonas sp. TH49]MBK5343940.1 hypothetical protein [Pseudomonas sp. TH49]